jgi:peptidyl-prolyl cis-trans isomerase C
MTDTIALTHTTSTTPCSIKPAITARPKAVSVNGVTIARDAIARETQNHPATRPIEAWQAAARALVVRELLLQEARRLEVAAEPATDDEGRRETEDEARIRALIEREVRTPKPDEASCQRYYAQNQRRFRSPAIADAAHILLPIGRGSADRGEAARLAAELLAVLAANPAAFAGLAKLHSACPSREVGGSLGQIGPGQTVPEFEAALAAMVPGAIHPQPVESRYGLHIVRLDRRMEGRLLPFEHARPLIAAYLAEHVQRTAQRQYLSLLAGRATITGVTLDAAPSPLVQ